MPITIVLHPTGEEAIVGEVENLPHPEDISILVTNPRRLDGKELHYLVENVITVIWPIARLNFIEIIPTKDEEKITGFYRD